MVALNLCDKTDININSDEFRNKIAESVKSYVLHNFNNVVKCDKYKCDTSEYPDEFPYRVMVTVEL